LTKQGETAIQKPVGAPESLEIRALARTPGELKQVIDAELAGDPFVTWRRDGKLFILALTSEQLGRVAIGRDARCEIDLDDPQVSRTHAMLERVGGDWTFVDDVSRNGSYVNGERVVGRRRLSGGERICLGSSELYFGVATPRVATQTVTLTQPFTAKVLSETQKQVLVALCRPRLNAESAIPATNRAIAAEVGLSEQAVKSHLRSLFRLFGLDELAQNEKRAELATRAIVSATVVPHDF
jgi:FHA domain